MKQLLLWITLLCFLMACQPSTTIDPVITKENKPFQWNPPATLQGNVEQDLTTLASFTSVSFNPSTAKNGSVVYVPANSNDALEAAVLAAGPNGTVVVETGDHYESSSVVVSHRINILGEPGAVIHSGVQNLLNISTLDPAIHLNGAGQSVVAGLEFLPTAGAQDGGTVFLVENSDLVHIALNKMTGFEFGVLIEQSDNVFLTGNEIISSTLWATVGLECHGIVVINGEKAKIRYNNISSSFFGVWACDGKGLYQENYTHSNYLGLILCNVPANAFPLPSGQLTGSANPANHWQVIKNQSDNNFNVGYLVIDNANNNTLNNNKASGNGDYDIELTADTYRFGFLTPASYDNTVNDAGNGLTIKDCGNNNVVNGGNQINTTSDPCN